MEWTPWHSSKPLSKCNTTLARCQRGQQRYWATAATGDRTDTGYTYSENGELLYPTRTSQPAPKEWRCRRLEAFDRGLNLPYPQAEVSPLS